MSERVIMAGRHAHGVSFRPGREPSTPSIGDNHFSRLFTGLAPAETQSALVGAGVGVSEMLARSVALDWAYLVIDAA
jgi:hypothetical protein